MGDALRLRPISRRSARQLTFSPGHGLPRPGEAIIWGHQPASRWPTSRDAWWEWQTAVAPMTVVPFTVSTAYFHATAADRQYVHVPSRPTASATLLARTMSIQRLIFMRRFCRWLITGPLMAG